MDFDSTGGTDTISNSGGSDSFLTKYNTDGTYGWTRKISSTTIDDGFSVTTDSNHNVIFVGYFTGSNVDFDGTGATDNHSTTGSYDVYISKYASDGAYVWSQTFGGTLSDYGARFVIVDGSNNIYTTGIFQSANADFDATGGTDTHATNGNYDVFITKYLENGNYGWTRTYGGTAADWGRSLAINGTTLYTSAYFAGDVDLDPTGGTNNVTAIGNPDAVISAFDLNGNYLWSEIIGNAGWEDPNSIVYYDSALWVAGNFNGTNSDLDFSTENALFSSNPSDIEDIFVSKYSDGPIATATPTATSTPTMTPTATITLTPTSTPTNTFTPTPNSSQNNSSSGTSSQASGSSAPTCDTLKLTDAPDLFQIDVTSTDATLFYTPIHQGVTDYVIGYSTKSNGFEHAIGTDQGDYSGVIHYTVKNLKPNTSYYFRVRGQKGCMPGDWSNKMEVKTKATHTSDPFPYYRYSSKTSVMAYLVGLSSQPTPSASEPSAVLKKNISADSVPEITPTLIALPTSAPVKIEQKFCILWWCF